MVRKKFSACLDQIFFEVSNNNLILYNNTLDKVEAKDKYITTTQVYFQMQFIISQDIKRIVVLSVNRQP